MTTMLMTGPLYGDRGIHISFPKEHVNNKFFKDQMDLNHFMSVNQKFDLLDGVYTNNGLPKISQSSAKTERTLKYTMNENEQNIMDWNYLANYDIQGLARENKIVADLDVPNIPPPQKMPDPTKRKGNVHNEHGGVYYRGDLYRKFWLEDGDEAENLNYNDIKIIQE